MNKVQRADLASSAEKDAFRVKYVREQGPERLQQMDNKVKPSIRRRTVKNDAEELVAIGDKKLAHEEASKIRENIRMVLTDGVRVMHVRHLQENHMEFVTLRDQKQTPKDQLAALGYRIISGYSPLFMQVRLEPEEEKRARRNAYCAARAIERPLKGNLGRSVLAHYKKPLAEVKGKFPIVFTDKGLAEFNLECGVCVEKETFQLTNNSSAKSPIIQARDSSVPGDKRAPADLV